MVIIIESKKKKPEQVHISFAKWLEQQALSKHKKSSEKMPRVPKHKTK